jgi:glutaredoxin
MKKSYYWHYLQTILLSLSILVASSGITNSSEYPTILASTNVTIWTTPKCHYCDKAKAYFQQRKIPYTEYDVSHRKIAVPVIFVCGQRMQGWDVQRFEQLYARCR